MSRTFRLGDHRALLAPLNEESYSDPEQRDSSWTDVFGNASEGQGAASLTLDPFRDTPAQILCMRHDQNDDLTFYFQFPHSWNKGQVRPHIHYVPLADPAAPQVVRFAGQYVWSAPGVLALPANAGWTPFGPIDVTINPGDVYIQRAASFGEIDPPAAAQVESAILVFFMQRSGLDVADTYTTSKDHGIAAANLGVLYIDVHIQQEKIGTVDEFPEQG